jgi:hypothetical protein
MEPTDALRSIETALRLLISDVLGETAWLSSKGAPDRARLEQRQLEEARRRDGASVSVRLIDYTETYHLTALIEKNWDKFQPALQDKNRTLAFFGVVEDVRNSVAHSRNLVPFERDLISGIAGQIRNQISLFRNERTNSGRYYPLIESVRDGFGNEGGKDQDLEPLNRLARLEIGDVIKFEGTAFSARGKGIKWQIVPNTSPSYYSSYATATDVAEGDSVDFEYVVTEDNVGETFALQVRIATDSKYHRYTTGNITPFDDSRAFLYAVNPPEDD